MLSSYCDVMSEQLVTREMAGALARFWSGGEGPSHTSISTAFALAGYVEPARVGNKQQRVLVAVRDSDEDVAPRLVEELLRLLRSAGEFDRNEDYPPLRSLRTAFDRAGHSLTNEGYVGWRPPTHIQEPASSTRTSTHTTPSVPDAQALLLTTLRDVFRENGAWPTHEYVEAVLDEEGLEVRHVLESMPPGWILPDRRFFGGVVYVAPEEPLQLTAAGLHRCPGADELIELFIRALKWGVENRAAHRPSPTTHVEPTWTFNDYLLAITDAGANPPSLNDALLILEVMHHEPGLIRWSGSVEDPYQREIRIPREIKQWRGVTTSEQFIERREVIMDGAQGTSKTPIAPGAEPVDMRSATIFLVHGHNDARKHEVARALQTLTQREPVILHERPNRGQTIIEKFERHARSAAFAIVLLTGDDEGHSVAEGADSLRPRSRQNVVFELGFFVGAIGREHVVALYEKGVELPSDLNGLLYTELDQAGAWKTGLARELRAAGIDAEISRLFD